MSDSPQGSGWLQGPNGKWYPPPPSAPAAPSVPPPPSGPAYESPAYDRIGHQPYEPMQYQPLPYQPPYYVGGPVRTSGLAIASLVLGILWVYWIGSILALIFGYTALKQMRVDPTLGGRGMAIAGVVLGWVGVGTLTLLIALVSISAAA